MFHEKITRHLVEGPELGLLAVAVGQQLHNDSWTERGLTQVPSNFHRFRVTHCFRSRNVRLPSQACFQGQSIIMPIDLRCLLCEMIISGSGRRPDDVAAVLTSRWTAGFVAATARLSQ